MPMVAGWIRLKTRLKRMQYRPSLLAGFLASTRLHLEPRRLNGKFRVSLAGKSARPCAREIPCSTAIRCC
jgi:hypothetical protein